MPYVNPLDPLTPAAGAFLSEGDDRIREVKAAIRERLLTIFQDVDANPLVFIDGIITTAAINDQDVTTAKIADAAVTTAKIADNAVSNAKIQNLDGGKIDDGTVTDAELAANSVTTTKIADNSVTNDKLADNAVETVHIADGSITNAKIADATLEIAKLSATAKGLLAQTKSITVNVVTGNQAADTSTQVASAAFVGAKTNDHVGVGLHDMDGLPEDILQGWVAYVDAVDHVKLYVRNNSGGNKTWSTAAVKLFITKPIADW